LDKFQINSKLSVNECKKRLSCSDCNLLLISVDSLNASHIGALKYERGTTPFLDSLSKNGYLFANYFTTSFLTPVTTMSLLTGMYPSSLGINNFYPDLPEDTESLALILKKQGYYNLGIHTSPEYSDTPIREGFHLGFDRHLYLVPRVLPKISLIEEEIQKVKNGKFFLWLSIGSVHWPFEDTVSKKFTNYDYDGIFKGKKQDLQTFQFVYDGKYYSQPLQGIDLKTEDIQFVIDSYDNGIYDFDGFIKNLFALLKREKLDKNTIVVINSEHGEELHRKGYFAHYDIYDNQIHTPLYFIFPNNNQGKIINNLASTVDVLPTILEIFGMAAPTQTEGESLFGYMCGSDENTQKAVFSERVPLWEQITMGEESINNTMKSTGSNLKIQDIQYDSSIRTKEWKYIERSAKPFIEQIWFWWGLVGGQVNITHEELYNIIRDPQELENLSDKEIEVKNILIDRLKKWQDKTRNETEENNDIPSNIQEYF
jgi:arylsulfatase A-like enzyme